MGGGFSAGQVQAAGGTVNTAISAAGTTRATATALTAAFNLVSTAAANSGVSLPAVSGPGDEVVVFNDGAANAFFVYPDSATIKINNITAGVGILVAPNTVCNFYKVSATRWVANLSA
jgi:4-hydroxyphenylpyruvate dioxygenase-like putative hemolysin